MGQCVSRKAGAVFAASTSNGKPSYKIMDKKSSKKQRQVSLHLFLLPPSDDRRPKTQWLSFLDFLFSISTIRRDVNLLLLTLVAAHFRFYFWRWAFKWIYGRDCRKQARLFVGNKFSYLFVDVRFILDTCACELWLFNNILDRGVIRVLFFFFISGYKVDVGNVRLAVIYMINPAILDTQLVLLKRFSN